MDQILEFFGFPTTGKGATWGLIMIILLAINVLDLFNIFDGIGFTKKTLNKFLPSIFKADKFRKVEETTASKLLQA